MIFTTVEYYAEDRHIERYKHLQKAEMLSPKERSSIYMQQHSNLHDATAEDSIISENTYTLQQKCKTECNYHTYASFMRSMEKLNVNSGQSI